jgi:hypothetical protein
VLSDRRSQNGECAHFSCEWRRPRGSCLHHAHRCRISTGLQEGCRRGHHLLSACGAQRGRQFRNAFVGLLLPPSISLPLYHPTHRGSDALCFQGDEPRFTQPLMYKLVDKHKSTLDLYRAKLKEEGVINDEHIRKMEETVMAEYNAAFKASSIHIPNKADWFSSYWRGFKAAHQYSTIRPTAVPEPILKKALPPQ